jgi:folate-binding protein YgfZ
MNDIFVFRLDPATQLVVRGSDAATFLQGQFSNDLRRAQPGGCTYGLWLNHKGRVLADSYVLERGENDFAVVSLTSPETTIRERLEAFIIADDVEVSEAPARGAGWILTAPALAALGLPEVAVGSFASTDGAVLFRVRALDIPNWLLLAGGPHEAAWAARMNQLVESSPAIALPEAEVRRRRLTAGLPEIPTELGPGDLPNEGGLEHEALSFTKGCYLGQEVMARLHNLGQVRRRLFVVRPESGTDPLAAGEALWKADRQVGEVRGSAGAGAGAVALAMLHTSHVSAGELLARSAAGEPTVRVVRLAEGRAW